jgi:hypothetical protein
MNSAQYVQAPWRLRGWAIQTLHAIPIAIARRYVPRDLLLIPIWRGHTLATVLFASYESGSLAYRELLLGIGLVWLRGPRFCIPRIWVDSEASVTGGREIWRLPKAIASFDVRRNDGNVQIAAHGICQIEGRASRYAVPLWLPALAFGQHANAFFPFTAYMRARASLAHVAITALSDEFAAMQFGRPLLAMHYESLDLLVHGLHPVLVQPHPGVPLIPR